MHHDESQNPRKENTKQPAKENKDMSLDKWSSQQAHKVTKCLATQVLSLL